MGEAGEADRGGIEPRLAVEEVQHGIRQVLEPHRVKGGDEHREVLTERAEVGAVPLADHDLVPGMTQPSDLTPELPALDNS